MKTTVLLSFLMLLTIVDASAAEAGAMEKTISNFYQAVDAGDFDSAAALLSDDVKVSIPFVPQIIDKMTYKQIGMSMKAGFPDMRHQILEVTESKNTAAFKGIFTGTNTGSLQGNPPTGNRVEQAFLGYLKFDKSGKINEVSLQFDVANFNAQLMKDLPDPRESLKQIGRNMLQQLDRRNLEGVIAHFSPDARFNGWTPQALDVEGYRQIMSGLLAAFPDSRFTVDDVLADGDKILVRHHLEGTHTGAAFQGVPAGGKKVYVNAVVTFRIANGKAAEAWLNADFLGMLTQLGVVPAHDLERSSEATIRQMLAAVDAGDGEKFMSFCTPDGVHYFGGKPYSLAETKGRIMGFKMAFPDIRREVEEVIVKGNSIVARGTLTGTNTGAFMGNAPTGKKIKTNWLALYHLNGAGKVVSGWVEFDTAAMQSQLMH